MEVGAKEDMSGRKFPRLIRTQFVKGNDCELKISKKEERVPAHLEKCKTRKGKKYEPKLMLEAQLPVAVLLLMFRYVECVGFCKSNFHLNPSK